MKTQLRHLSAVNVLLLLGGMASTLLAGTICPPVGVATVGTGVNAGTGCFVLFTYSNSPSGGVTITRTIDPTVQRYDSMDGDDVTVGVVNNVQAATAAFFITELDLTPTNPAGDFSGPNIFNFDSDGICGVSPAVSASCPFTPVGPAGSIANSYSGPLSTFMALTLNSGKVFFSGGGVGPGKTTYFSLEDVPGGGGNTPEPTVALLVASGLIFLGLLRRRRVL
jgi:hypothetical protein